MQLDAQDLSAFYRSPLGQVVRRILAHRIRSRWRRAQGLTVAGLGFPPPLIGSFRGEAARLIALMPAYQGAVVWPRQGPVMSVLVDEDRLPLADNSVDRLLVVHCLETSDQSRAMLRELWRVLSPEGRLLIVVPNRRSMWARRDITPFGQGQPYSRGQLQRLLVEALFHPLDVSTALHVPPVEWRPLLRWATAFERFGGRFFPGFGGVLLAEARKEVAETLTAPGTARRAGRLVPVGLGGND